MKKSKKEGNGPDQHGRTAGRHRAGRRPADRGLQARRAGSARVLPTNIPAEQDPSLQSGEAPAPDLLGSEELPQDAPNRPKNPLRLRARGASCPDDRRSLRLEVTRNRHRPPSHKSVFDGPGEEVHHKAAGFDPSGWKPANIDIRRSVICAAARSTACFFGKIFSWAFALRFSSLHPPIHPAKGRQGPLRELTFFVFFFKLCRRSSGRRTIPSR